jgi:hypothetical protein
MMRRNHEVLTLFITLGVYAITARRNLIGSETMNDTITQVRLSMCLDIYLRDYTEKNVRNENLYREEWEIVWQGADAACTHTTLTPELVDDVRVALNKL